jgi:hypothetical protein
MTIVLQVTWFGIFCGIVAYLLSKGTPMSVIARLPFETARAATTLFGAALALAGLALFAIGSIVAMIAVPLWLLSKLT